MARSRIPSVFDFGLPTIRAATDPFMLLHREVNRLFDETLRAQTPPPSSGEGMIAPRMNVSETDQEIRIATELPGVPEQDVEIDLAGDVLTIRGEKREEREDAQHHITERSFGTFARTVRLPFAPRPEDVRARFEHGVLRVTLPKSAPQTRSSRIPVRSGVASGTAEPSGAEGCFGAPAAVAGHPTPDTTHSGAAPGQANEQQAGQQGTDEEQAAAHPS